MKNAYIYRSGLSFHEREVGVRLHTGPRVEIDPQQEVRKVFDLLLPRDYCIVALAQGLKMAGHAVVIEQKFWNRTWQTCSFKGAGQVPLRPEYVLVGYMVGLRQWSAFKNKLGTLNTQSNPQMVRLGEVLSALMH